MTNFWFYLSPSIHEKDVYTTMWHLNCENELKTENDRNFANLVGPNFTKKYNANKIIKHIHQQMTNILIFASY